MKRLHKRQRIFILSLLCFSVFAPIVLVSFRLGTPSLDGNRDFEDLSTIKYKADTLELSAIQQEEAEVKEPKQEVYRDQRFSILKNSSHESLKDTQSDSESINISSFGRKGTNLSLKEENVQILQKKVPPTTSSQEKGAISSPAIRSQHNHDSQIQKRRAMDERVKEIKDQLIRAKAYLSFAIPAGNTHLIKELRVRIKEVDRALGDAKRDSDLSRNAYSRMRHMEATLLKASRVYPDCSSMVKKLRAMAQSAEEQVHAQRNQTAFLTLLAGRTTPKGLHCLSMRLTAEYFALQPEKREPSNQVNFYNPKLFHYVVFSDNVLACSVVVNSTVSAAKEPEKIVFHIVSDSLNFPAISMWFLLNPAGKATVQVQSIDSFKQLSAKYGPKMVPKVDNEKSIDPRYSTPLNHLRFYLPELFPQLDKILFLDHDVVILKDLSAIWKVDMKGKVNGAVHTCRQGEPSHRRMDMLVNFSDPWVSQTFDAKSCTWAFGMNLFDLREWRKQDLSSKYNNYLHMGYSRPLWKSGSLPLGWVTFYNNTHHLDRKWHVFGLGYETGSRQEDIEQAAVIHYDGIMKPWLDIGMRRYKGYWIKHLDFNHPHLQQCNIHG
ncbi:hypothetical protein V2J09_004980 [Rumex salicifolius]